MHLYSINNKIYYYLFLANKNRKLMIMALFLKSLICNIRYECAITPNIRGNAIATNETEVDTTETINAAVEDAVKKSIDTFKKTRKMPEINDMQTEFEHYWEVPTDRYTAAAAIKANEVVADTVAIAKANVAAGTLNTAAVTKAKAAANAVATLASCDMMMMYAAMALYNNLKKIYKTLELTDYNKDYSLSNLRTLSYQIKNIFKNKLKYDFFGDTDNNNANPESIQKDYLKLKYCEKIQIDLKGFLNHYENTFPNETTLDLNNYDNLFLYLDDVESALTTNGVDIIDWRRGSGTQLFNKMLEAELRINVLYSSITKYKNKLVSDEKPSPWKPYFRTHPSHNQQGLMSYDVEFNTSNGFGLVLVKDENQVRVHDFELVNGKQGSAEKCGMIKVKDVLVKVNNICVKKKPYNEVIDLVNSEKLASEKVTLSFERGNNAGLRDAQDVQELMHIRSKLNKVNPEWVSSNLANSNVRMLFSPKIEKEVEKLAAAMTRSTLSTLNTPPDSPPDSPLSTPPILSQPSSPSCMINRCSESFKMHFSDLVNKLLVVEDSDSKNLDFVNNFQAVKDSKQQLEQGNKGAKPPPSTDSTATTGSPEADRSPAAAPDSLLRTSEGTRTSGSRRCSAARRTRVTRTPRRRARS